MGSEGSEGRKKAPWWRRLPGWVSFTAAAFGVFAGLILTIDAGISIVQWANRTFDWRDDEYGRLTSLKAGFDIRYLEDQLGRPVATGRGEDGYVESTFRGRDYWAQAISLRGEVQLFAVTSCDPGFQPSFKVPNLPSGETVDLERDSLADVHAEGGSYEYMLGANVFWFLDAIYGALSGHYKTYAWGVTSTCGSDNIGSFKPDSLDPSDYRGAVASMPAEVEGFRRETTINTFVETAPGTTLFEGQGASRMNLSEFHGFRIGPPVVLWRSVTADPFSEERRDDG